ncbi:hypothetical protein pipiens_007145 [Culex pipiens pipiens]|uniref:Uncharacterized protein n=2 Tax=Culex pipiens pipiens TaxID=38569 RepID=A0ABD1DM29_CULPP
MILVCSICGASHYTQNCPDFAKGDHIKDKPSLNLSRSSVPNGLLIMDSGFAKGTRFGPLLAQKSYTPIKGLPFPLVLFANTPPSYYYGTDLLMLDFELQTLLSGRNVYLDTRNESKCNWMIHVSLARFSNEQNLICYQENDEIYYTAIKDIELGDILRVWYSRSYAAKIGATLLEPSPYDICNNILRSVSLDYGLDLDQNQNYLESFPSTSGGTNNQLSHHHHHASSSSSMVGGSDVNNNSNGGNSATVTSSSLCGDASSSSYDKISLPPIDSLMKTTSPKYTTNHYHMFDLDLIGGTSQSCEDYGQFNPTATSCSPSLVPIHHQQQQQHHHHPHHHSSQLGDSPSHSQFAVQQPHHSTVTDMHQHQQQQLVHSSYGGYHQQTLPEDTLSPADLINISLGASDMNIAFDSFEAGNLIGYDGGNSSSGSNLADSGISIGHGGVGMLDGGGGGKLHSRYSSSSDSLVTLNDSMGGGMVPVAPSSVTPIPSAMGGGGVGVLAGNGAVDPEADKKYPCEICLRKYMTKSNLDKHMRKHNLFLCVFCMKLFQLAEELKDHECTERKSKTAYLHCPKCLKVLSNSWSLQRHMKIHKDSNGDQLTDGLLRQQSESSDKMLLLAGGEPKDEPSIPFDELESTGLDELKPSLEPFEATEPGTDMDVHHHHHHHHHLLDMAGDEANDGTVLLESGAVADTPLVALSSITTIPITNTSSSQDMITDVQAPNGKQLYKCIVCAKLFKNPNALEKHLRKVHTVYTISNDYKTEKKVLTQINQKKTSPIKPAIAKALATKLTQKSKKMEAAAASSNGASPAAANSPTNSGPIVITPVEQIQQPPPPPPVHVPRPYNKKKHLNNVKLPTSTTPAGPLQLTTIPATATANQTTAGNKSHSIIIISNLELTNNNLIDTSQLFLNQNSNALGNKIDVKVLNSTDKLPKLVPISSHGPSPPSILPSPQQQQQQQFVGLPSLHPTTTATTTPTTAAPQSEGSCALNALIESSGINVDESQDSHLLTLSPIKMGSNSNGGATTIITSGDASSNSFLGPDELSADANDSNQQYEDGDSGDSPTGAQLTQTSYPCEECDRVFPKNYQLKRHMEIHDSTYYMCPYCDRSPLKAKTSVRKHLNTVHPERAPPKEEMNKFIATLVVKDEKILNELFIKNERKIRAKCAKQQAKQLQLQMQKQQQQQLSQQAVVIVQDVAASAMPTEQQEEVIGVAYSDEQQPAQQASAIPDNSQQLGGYESEENQGVDCGSSANGPEVRSDDESNGLKRRVVEGSGSGSVGQCGGSKSNEEVKRIRLVDANGQEVRYIAAASSNGTALKYLRKKSIGVGEGSSSSSGGNPMHPPGTAGGGGGGGQPTNIDNQMILDNLFDNISIENYEFDDNTSIQSYNMIEERFKTSFDQIQEKLDAELSFDEEQLKWQNNLMANDSSNEIGDKLLNVEDNPLARRCTSRQKRQYPEVLRQDIYLCFLPVELGEAAC